MASLFSNYTIDKFKFIVRLSKPIWQCLPVVSPIASGYSLAVVPRLKYTRRLLSKASSIAFVKNPGDNVVIYGITAHSKEYTKLIAVL